MKSSNQTTITRRDAFRRMLGMAGAAPLALSGLGVVPSVLGEDFATGNTVRIEEDWYLKIGAPEPEADSPQISTVLAPSWTLWGKFAVFDMNCATQPGFSSGGVQLQLWQDDEIVQSRSNTNWDSLHMVNEEIRYTSAMSIVDGNLVFEILNGSSETWGSFGNGELKIATPTWRSHINWYDPTFTTWNSRIGFASHRVRRFVMERVRYIKSNGTEILDDVPRVLHQYDPVS